MKKMDNEGQETLNNCSKRKAKRINKEHFRCKKVMHSMMQSLLQLIQKQMDRDKLAMFSMQQLGLFQVQPNLQRKQAMGTPIKDCGRLNGLKTIQKRLIKTSAHQQNINIE